VTIALSGPLRVSDRPSRRATMNRRRVRSRRAMMDKGPANFRRVMARKGGGRCRLSATSRSRRHGRSFSRRRGMNHRRRRSRSSRSVRNRLREMGSSRGDSLRRLRVTSDLKGRSRVLFSRRPCRLPLSRPCSLAMSRVSRSNRGPSRAKPRRCDNRHLLQLRRCANSRPRLPLRRRRSRGRFRDRRREWRHEKRLARRRRHLLRDVSLRRGDNRGRVLRIAE
jgi:hypothetical protein